MGLYGLPFEGIRDIRVARIQAEVRELALYQGIVVELKQTMQSMFGYSLPIGLARVRDKAYAPLAWRDMAKKCKLVGGLDSELGQPYWPDYRKASGKHCWKSSANASTSITWLVWCSMS